MIRRLLLAHLEKFITTWSLTSGGNYQISYHQKCIIL